MEQTKQYEYGGRWLIGYFVVAMLLLAVFIFGISRAEAAPPTATITFPAVTQDTDNAPLVGPVTYNVYQALKGSPTVKVGTITTTNTTVTAGLQGGLEYCWQVTAIAQGIEGAKSIIDPVKSCKKFDPGTPGIVVITVT